jgi:hypothetical protein
MKKDPLRSPRPPIDPDQELGATTPTELLLALGELKRIAYARYWSLRRGTHKASPEHLNRLFARIEGIDASITLVERALRGSPDTRIDVPRATVKRCPRCRARHRINPDAVAPVRRWVRRDRAAITADGLPNDQPATAQPNATAPSDTTTTSSAPSSSVISLDDLPF